MCIFVYRGGEGREGEGDHARCSFYNVSPFANIANVVLHLNILFATMVYRSSIPDGTLLMILCLQIIVQSHIICYAIGYGSHPIKTKPTL